MYQNKNIISNLETKKNDIESNLKILEQTEKGCNLVREITQNIYDFHEYFAHPHFSIIPSSYGRLRSEANSKF